MRQYAFIRVDFSAPATMAEELATKLAALNESCPDWATEYWRPIAQSEGPDQVTILVELDV